MELTAQDRLPDVPLSFRERAHIYSPAQEARISNSHTAVPEASAVLADPDFFVDVLVLDGTDLETLVVTTVSTTTPFLPETLRSGVITS